MVINILRFGSHIATHEATTPTHEVWRISSVLPLSEVKKHFEKHGYNPDNVFNPHSTHNNPISSYWLIKKNANS